MPSDHWILFWCFNISILYFGVFYYRLYGSYESLDAGQTYDALIDMSGWLESFHIKNMQHYSIWIKLLIFDKGGIQEQFDLKNLPREEASRFWEILSKGFSKDSIMGCSINVGFKIISLTK